MSNVKGYVYILTNPSFPNYVKIGYADDVEERLKQLNRSECIPFAFRVYATYAVSNRLDDMKIHNVIDTINPSLRSIDTVDGKKRIREFYAMTPEDAYLLFEAIAQINGLECNLKKWKLTDKEQKEEKEAEAIAKRSSNFSFKSAGIPVGSKLVFVKDPSMVCYVRDDGYVDFNGERKTVSGIASEYFEHRVNGYLYFEYEGEILADRRERLENEGKWK